MTRILITTSNSFLELDTETGTHRIIHRGQGLYYGIAMSQDYIFLACRNRLVSSTEPLENEKGEVLVFDHLYQFIGSISAPFPLRDMHGIAWHNEKLWITCSFNNLIAIWDGDVWEQWYPLESDKNANVDIHHYNSFLFLQDGFWLLAHNNGKSDLLFFNNLERKLIQKIPLGRLAHNIWIEDGNVYTCSSGEGKILGTNGFQFKTGGFPRGYSLDEYGIRYLGLNEYAERARRDKTNSHVILYDKGWEEIKVVPLLEEGMILDILVLPS